MPLICNYYLTLRCNARCTFCDLWQDEDRSLADADKVIENIQQLPKVGVRILDFTGGEPLLHPELPHFLRTAKKSGLITTITTNGILYPRCFKELRGLVNLLHISIDGASAEVHDELRGVPCFDRVMESIELALTIGEKPDLLFTTNVHNYQHITPLAELARKRNLTLIVNPVFAARGGNGCLNRSQLNELTSLCRLPNIYINGGVLKLLIEGGNRLENPRCRAVSSSLVISPKNELLLPCFHYAHTAIPIDGRLSELLKDKRRILALQQQGRESFCQGCTINCYLAPSLPYKIDRYLAAFIPWAIKYLISRSNLLPHHRLKAP